MSPEPSGSAATNRPARARRPLGWVLVAVVGIKLALFAADHSPLFFLGDSSTYIDTAVSGSVPGERSFTYGWAVRGLAVWPGTLTTLVFAQCMAGAVTAGLLAYALRVCFGVRAWVAIGVAVASCFDPLQVVHERLVLTEAFAQLVFVAHSVAALRYLRTTERANLLAVAGTGIVLVSLRSVYLPVVLLDAVAVPLLAALFSTTSAPASVRAKRCVGHLAVSLLVTAPLHLGYREWVGWLTHTRPTYLPEAGLFQAAAWAPALTPDDAADPRVAGVIRELERGPRPLADPANRDYHRWHADGMAKRLRREFGSNAAAASDAAGTAATRALARDPVGVGGLAVGTYIEHFRYLEAPTPTLETEQGTGRRPPDGFLRKVAGAFGMDATNVHLERTPSRSYHLAGWPWYALLLASPAVCWIAVLAVHPSARGEAVLVATHATILLAVTMTLATGPVFRYLCPLSFPYLIAVGTLLESAARSLGEYTLPTSRESRVAEYDNGNKT